jgi:hypothetical protein
MYVWAGDTVAGIATRVPNVAPTFAKKGAASWSAVSSDDSGAVLSQTAIGARLPRRGDAAVRTDWTAFGPPPSVAANQMQSLAVTGGG